MNENKARSRLDQRRAPIYEALERFRQMRVVPFDVPGHKRGRGNPELTAFLGQQCVGVDVNSMKPLDNLCHPVSVIREAEELAADAFGAAHAFLMVGGTTSSVQSMVLTACKRGDEIILPRNVHRSVLNALVLCGAVPVYVNPEVDKRLGISLGMKREQVAKAIKEHPNAVAVLVNNPTYYGICSDLRAIVKMAHDAGMLCLADEAHGTHFYFGGGLPVSAMAAGADMASVSMHKSGGSLTQSMLFLTFLVNVLMMVYKNQDLLRASIASARAIAEILTEEKALTPAAYAKEYHPEQYNRRRLMRSDYAFRSI